MDINGTRRIEPGFVRRANKPGSAGGPSFAIPANETPRAQTPASPGPIAALDSILTLQGLDDSVSGRSKGHARGERLLDMLDELRDGLLSGGISMGTLNRLASAVSQRHDHFADPKLQIVLDEIELRARVELAKLEQAAA